MTIDVDAPKLDPITAALMALRTYDPVLGVMAEVRETFGEGTRLLWDEGISRYLKLRYDAIVNAHFNGDHQLASTRMDESLADFDVAETVHRACDVTDAALMMEIVAYVMALAAVSRQPAVWRRFENIIGYLYRDLTPAAKLT